MKQNTIFQRLVVSLLTDTLITNQCGLRSEDYFRLMLLSDITLGEREFGATIQSMVDMNESQRIYLPQEKADIICRRFHIDLKRDDKFAGDIIESFTLTQPKSEIVQNDNG